VFHVKLKDLDAEFIKYTPYPDTWIEIRDGVEVSVSGERRAWKPVATLGEADGVKFLCIGCYLKNSGPVGTDTVICWFKGKVPDDLDPKPGRWNPVGTGLGDLTFAGPGPFSVAHPHWHGFVEHGEVNIR
jgi:hypothetical protein